MRKSFTLAFAISIVAAADGVAQQRGSAQIRFAQMDTNGDRVITRTEWRGSVRSFDVHDWNGDGVLSGEEVRPGGRRSARTDEPDVFDSADRDYEFGNWTAAGFRDLDHNQDGRIARSEWHFDAETFRRADHNRDGWLSRDEFLGRSADDDRDDRFSNLDTNNDGRVSRNEWHGTAERFDALDDNRDGVLTRAEARGTSDPPQDLFASVDVNGDSTITRNEWHWSRESFNQRDGNRDGRLSRDEFSRGPAATTDAWRAGQERGLAEGRQAGKEDRAAGWGWDLEGQRELENADSGYEARLGARADYQAGYRDGFRKGYREGFGR